MNFRSKKFVTTIALLLLLSMAASMILSTPVKGDGTISALPGITPPYEIPTVLHLIVGPDPIGVGQTVNINAFFGASIIDSEVPSWQKPANYNATVTWPSGKTQTFTLTADTTGGGYCTFVPNEIGEYKIQAFYGGQWLTEIGWVGLYQKPAVSPVYTLTVQEEPITQRSYPYTPLPNNWWENPVSAENTQNWYKMMGNYQFRGAFNSTTKGNPYSDPVMSGHILWTKPWGMGGVVGGIAGGGEQSGQFWTARQYQNQFNPIVMNGRLYAQWYPETTGYSNGILCIDLKTGETLWRINTTSTLSFGYVPQWLTINDYGAIGPYIFTTGSISASETGGKFVYSRGTQYNMYSGFTGQYIGSIVNGSSLSGMTTDADGHVYGYYTNSTVGTMSTWGISMPPGQRQRSDPIRTGTVNIKSGEKYLCKFNFSQLFVNDNSDWEWQQQLNFVVDFNMGVMFATKVPDNINGKKIDPTLEIQNMYSGKQIFLTSYMYPRVYWQSGWFVACAMNGETGAVTWIKNFTYPEYTFLHPFLRMSWSTSERIADNNIIALSYNTWEVTAIDADTGNKAWENTLKTDWGDGTPNLYDEVAQGSTKGLNMNGKMVIAGFGGDIWCIDTQTGKQLWYTNTTNLVGPSGVETPYNTWPIWPTQGPYTIDTGIVYLAIGHEYNPPMFHGAQLLAINYTDGKLVWSELSFSMMSLTPAYGVLLSLNCYDNQVYAYGKGPSAITVNAPSVGVTTETPVTISGTVTDVSAGVSLSEVAKNYPYGVPCVSDESQSKFMEHVYQDQPMPSNATGVPVTISVIDANGNYREIGVTTSDASGTYGLIWTPDISGKYTIYASFAGSNSYYPSSAEAICYASEKTSAATTAPQTQTGFATTSDLWLSTGVIAVVILIGIALAVLMLRKRP